MSAQKRTKARGTPTLARLWGMRFLVVLAAGLAIGGIGGVVAVNTLEPGRASEPDSVEMDDEASVPSATRSAARAGRAARAGPDNGAEDAPNVTRSEPPNTATVAETEDAATTAAASPELLAMPDVVGMEEGAARKAITGSGFTVGSVEFRASGTPLGTVITMAPAARSMVQRGTAVALILSSGRSL